MGAAKEFIGQAINEMFVIKKEAPSKRVLPSIQNMKIVSCSGANTFTNEHYVSRETIFLTLKHERDLEIPFSKHFRRLPQMKLSYK